MARNTVQFQKGLSEIDFDKAYGSEEQCHAVLVKWRWPDGFVCPDCDQRKRLRGKVSATMEIHGLRLNSGAFE